MSRRPTMATFRSKALRNPDVRAAYDALSSGFEVKRQMIALRKKAGLTQERMAELLGTKKSNILRLESLSSDSSPRLLPQLVSRLRNELGERAKRFAIANDLTHYESLGHPPTILFPAEPAKSRHGNFNDKSYEAILANASWAKRLEKPHPKPQALPEDRRGDAKELDSSNSSDALLMNCFCYPGSAERILQGCLQKAPTGPVEFGVAGNAPLRNGNPDTTDLDMRVGNTICEAKLTESDFTSKRAAVVEAYRDFRDVFDAGLLPRFEDKYSSYQIADLAMARNLTVEVSTAPLSPKRSIEPARIAAVRATVGHAILPCRVGSAGCIMRACSIGARRSDRRLSRIHRACAPR